MFNFYFALISLFLFTPIITPIVLPKDEDKSPEILAKEKVKSQHFKILAKNLHDKFGLEIEPYEWSKQKPEICKISFQTRLYDEISSLEDVRELIVAVVSYVLEYVNENPETVPILIEHPMSAKRVVFLINLVGNLHQDNWASVNLVDGVIYYTYAYHKIKVPSETFEEAKAKVEAIRRGR